MESFDNNSNGGRLVVVTELSQIKELVTRLEEQLLGGSHDLCRRLASQMFSIIERSIGIITSSDLDGGGARKREVGDAGLGSVTPRPSSTTKKRKTMMEKKRKLQVRVKALDGGKELVDDGHSWRKYGQKEILGAKHPRGYYRCTHRHSQGCTATKQVQRTDEDPRLFDVFYLGTHTCVHGTVESQGWGAASTTTPASICLAPERNPFSPPSTSEGASPATSDSNRLTSFPPFEFEAAEWQVGSELQDLLVASTPPVAGMGTAADDDQLVDVDISSFLL